MDICYQFLLAMSYMGRNTYLLIFSEMKILI